MQQTIYVWYNLACYRNSRIITGNPTQRVIRLLKRGLPPQLAGRIMRKGQDSIMTILVIDGQGGGLGKLIIAALKEEYPQYTVLAVGSNTVATTTMLKAGADTAATGENAVVVGCRRADIIIGPIGIVIADSMLGEITPAMAAAVGQSSARRILVPMNVCDNTIIGVMEQPVGQMVQGVVRAVAEPCSNPHTNG